MGQITELIENLLGRVEDAWNRADPAAYASLYAEDAAYVNRAGTLLVGREEIERQHGNAFAGPLQGTRLRLTARRITALSESIIVVHADVELNGPTTLWASTMFVVRDGLVVAAQTTEL